MKDGLPEIIAEIGLNHEGDRQAARAMIEAAARAGADAVKFQTCQPADLVRPSSPAWDELAAGALDLDDYLFLAEVAAGCGVEFLSTAFSRRAVDLLEQVGVRRFKIASMDLTNFDLLEYAAKTDKPILLSTGMGTLEEIAAAVEFLQAMGTENLTLLHCVSHYPARAEDLNLGAIGILKKAFDLPVGYSDHFPGVKACVAAALAGAEVLETHFTLDNTREGADHDHSADEAQLRGLADDLALFARMKGRPSFFDQRPDRPEAALYRRGLYAARDLVPGEAPGRSDLLRCRPEANLSPNDFVNAAGRKLIRPVKAGSPLSWEDFS